MSFLSRKVLQKVGALSPRHFFAARRKLNKTALTACSRFFATQGMKRYRHTASKQKMSQGQKIFPKAEASCRAFYSFASRRKINRYRAPLTAYSRYFVTRRKDDLPNREVIFPYMLFPLEIIDLDGLPYFLHGFLRDGSCVLCAFL
jgi:hypothetical protein